MVMESRKKVLRSERVKQQQSRSDSRQPKFKAISRGKMRKQDHEDDDSLLGTMSHWCEMRSMMYAARGTAFSLS